MSLPQNLDALRTHLEVGTRSDALVAMLRVMEEAASSDRATRALQAPSRAPACSLPDESSQVVSLSERLLDGPVVVVFYRGEWCTSCKKELNAVQGQPTDIGGYYQPDLAKLDAVMRPSATFNAAIDAVAALA